MAYKVIKAYGSTHGKARREFICDTAADVTNLPTSKKMGKAQAGDTVSDEMCAVGSTASITETGDLYELNASDTWVKKPAEGSGEGSDITIDKTLTQEGQAADAKAVGDALANKADSSALSSYVQTTTAESTYAKKADLESKADSSALANYVQTTTAEETYAKKTDLDAKADASALANYVQTSTAESTYAKKSEIPSKGTAVADATGAEDVVTQLNALIASLEAAGIINS